MYYIKKTFKIVCLLSLFFGIFSIKANARDFQAYIVNAQVSKYINNVKYTKTNKSQVEKYIQTITEQSSYPNPVTITFPALEEDVKIIISRKDYYYSMEYDGGNGKIAIYNLIPGLTYHYSIQDLYGNVIQSGSLKATGRLRMLHLRKGCNIRDLGGWKTSSGKRIRYGLLYRGAQYFTPSKAIDKKSLQEFMLTTGIRHDIDFRTAKEANNITASPFGSTVSYDRYSLKPYVLTTKTNKKLFIKTMRQIFCAVDKEEPVYFHCILGADRTGTVAFLIEGLLGVSESSLAKDYELTSFYELRTKDYYKYKSLVRQLKRCKGQTLQKKFENYFISLGFSKKEIRNFQNKMLK